MIYFSSATGGFYDSNIHGANIPAGAVEITNAQRLALLASQSQGKEIKADGSGRPVAADRAPLPPRVPYTVTPFQAKAAIYAAGLLPAVEAAIAAAPKVAQLAWSDATEFTRDSPTIAALSAQLGLSSAQVDALFIAAAAIEA